MMKLFVSDTRCTKTQKAQNFSSSNFQIFVIKRLKTTLDTAVNHSNKHLSSEAKNFHILEVRIKKLVKTSRVFVMVQTMLSITWNYVKLSSIKTIDRKIELFLKPCLQVLRF